MQKSKQRRTYGSEWQRETIFLLMTVQKDPVNLSWDVSCNMIISMFLWVVRTGWLVSESYIKNMVSWVWLQDPVLKWRPCWASRRAVGNHCRRCLLREVASHRLQAVNHMLCIPNGIADIQSHWQHFSGLLSQISFNQPSESLYWSFHALL